jgi:hypothetical protein
MDFCVCIEKRCFDKSVGVCVSRDVSECVIVYIYG